MILCNNFLKKTCLYKRYEKKNCGKLDNFFWVNLGKIRLVFHKMNFKAFKRGSKAIALSRSKK